MKVVFIIYHDILEDRVDKLLNDSGIDYYTKWEAVRGKGHQTDAHLGTRTFPGYNHVRMIAFDNDELLVKVISGVKELNNNAMRADDKIRLFMMPLEMVV